MLKYCEDCGQEKEFEPDALPRTKASGFYGWYCWDCHKQNALGRLRLRTEVQNPTYESLHAEVEELKARILVCKAEMLKIQHNTVQARREVKQITLDKARRARPKALPKNALSLPYGELVTESQKALDQFLQEMSPDHKDFTVRKHSLEHKLEYAQKKRALFGPDAFDVPKQVPKKYQ